MVGGPPAGLTRVVCVWPPGLGLQVKLSAPQNGDKSFFIKCHKEVRACVGVDGQTSCSIWLELRGPLCTDFASTLCVSVGGFLGRFVTGLVVCCMQVGLLRNLCHPNIVQYLDSFLEDDVLVIVLEWAGGGDLKVSTPPASSSTGSASASQQ